MLANLKARWASLNGNIKILIIALLIAIVIGSAFAIFTRSTYQTLYTGLSTDDQTAIEKYLSQNGIDYNEPATGTIQINGDVVQVKKDLALQSLPSGGVTNSLSTFGSTSLGSTQYDKEVQYQTGLQSDLDKNLVEMFDGIQKADVNIPKPQQQSIFSDNNTAQQVSVALKLKTGVTLSPEQVSAIQTFVAGALNNVKSTDVKVVDSKMNVLSNYQQDQTGMTKEQQIVNQTDLQLENKLKDNLNKVYGSVQVIVNVDINFDEMIRNITKYDPQGTLLSKETQSAKSSTTDGTTTTQPGTTSNGEVPNAQIDTSTNGNTLSTSDTEHLIENYDVGKTVDKIIKHPELRNINVAVWVDGDLTNSEITDLQQMVAVASGLTGTATPTGNDMATYGNGSVKITQKTFKTQPTDDQGTQGTATKVENTIPWTVYAIVGTLALLIFLLLFLLVFRRKKDKKSVDGLEQEEIELPKTEVEEELEEEILQGISAFKLDRLNQQQQDLRKVAGDAAGRHSKETANWVKKQLNE